MTQADRYFTDTLESALDTNKLFSFYGLESQMEEILPFYIFIFGVH